MPLIFGVFIAAAMVVGWFALTMKAPAARANLFVDLPAEAKPSTSGARALGDRLRRFVPTSLIKNMETELAQAGHPHGIDVPRLLGIQAVLIVVLSGLCLLAGNPAFILGAVPAGFIAP